VESRLVKETGGAKDVSTLRWQFWRSEKKAETKASAFGGKSWGEVAKTIWVGCSTHLQE